MDIEQKMEFLTPTQRQHLEELKLIFNQVNEGIIIKFLKQANFDPEVAADQLVNFCQGQECASNNVNIEMLSLQSKNKIRNPKKTEGKQGRQLKTKSKSLNEIRSSGWHTFTQKYHEQTSNNKGVELQYHYQKAKSNTLTAENFPPLNTNSTSHTTSTTLKSNKPPSDSSTPPSLTFLSEMFPSHSLEFLDNILRKTNNHMEKAVHLILSLDESETEQYRDEVASKATDTNKCQTLSYYSSPCEKNRSVCHDTLNRTISSLCNKSEFLRCESPLASTSSLTNVDSLPSTLPTLHTIRENSTVSTSSHPDYNSLYYDMRKEAIKFYRLRNQLYKKASRQYECGNHAEAKRLAGEAREHHQRATALNQLAAEKIFVHRNLNNDMYTIDLHGLHAGEALEFLTQRIKFLTHSKANSATPRKQEITLKIIVGIGRHQSANTVLGPTVQHFLDEQQYRYSVPRPGVFVVTIKPPDQMNESLTITKSGTCNSVDFK